jgi:hypothetical protein
MSSQQDQQSSIALTPDPDDIERDIADPVAKHGSERAALRPVGRH